MHSNHKTKWAFKISHLIKGFFLVIYKVKDFIYFLNWYSVSEILFLLYKYSHLVLFPASFEYKKILNSLKSSLAACLLPSQICNWWKAMNCLFFVLAFQVLYWTDDPKESTAGKVRVRGNVTAKNITGLKANTVYFATVWAYNTAGTGPSSTPVNVTTKKSREYSI